MDNLNWLRGIILDIPHPVGSLSRMRISIESERHLTVSCHRLSFMLLAVEPPIELNDNQRKCLIDASRQDSEQAGSGVFSGSHLIQVARNIRLDLVAIKFGYTFARPRQSATLKAMEEFKNAWRL